MVAVVIFHMLVDLILEVEAPYAQMALKLFVWVSHPHPISFHGTLVMGLPMFNHFHLEEEAFFAHITMEWEFTVGSVLFLYVKFHAS